MNQAEKNEVKTLAFGVLFDNSFTLLDKWGEIADAILYKSEYFSSKYFPKISTYYTLERRLFNDELGHEFRLSASNIIYTHVIQTSFTKEFGTFSSSITKYILPRIIEEFRLSVIRIGIVYTCQIENAGIKEFRNKYFKDEFSSITDFRFAKKEASREGLSKTDSSDYINKIYTSIPKDDGENLLSFDYQHHYNPHKGSITEKEISGVLEDSKTALNNEILSLGNRHG